MEEDTGKLTHVGGATGRIHGRRLLAGRLQPGRRPADRDRHQADRGRRGAAPRRSPGPTSPRCATCCARSGVSDVRMEQGSLRCDVNVSLRPTRRRRARAPAPRPRTSTRCARSSGRCATRSAGRPRCSTAGGTVVQETRHWHEDTGLTTSGRIKEDAEDYRYFPEPDLVPIAPSREWVEELRATLPETAVRCGASGCSRSGASPTRRCATSSTPARSTWSRRPSPPAPTRPRRASGGPGSWSRIANEQGVELADARRSPRPRSPSCEALVDDGTLTDKLARQVIEGVLAGEGAPDEVVAGRGLAVVSDDGALLGRHRRGAGRQPDVAEKIRGGKVAGGRRDRRCGDEGHPRPGRRRPRCAR